MNEKVIKIRKTAPKSNKKTVKVDQNKQKNDKKPLKNDKNKVAEQKKQPKKRYPSDYKTKKYSKTGKNYVTKEDVKEVTDPGCKHIYYEELTPLLVKSLSKNKYTEKEISKILGMTETTFNVWKKKFPKLLESLKEGNASADDLVVNALLRRALGFSYTEYKEGTSRKNGKYTETTIKYVVPNVTACFGWLNNRDPKNWRHKKDKEPDEVNNNSQQENEFSNMSTKELVNCIKEMEDVVNE